METKEIRLHNLLALSATYHKIVDFCERIGMNPSYFSQIKSGKKAIGDDVARRVEQSLGLARGYLDTLQGSPASAPPETDAMATAYSIQSLPGPIRDQLQRLIHQIAVYCHDVPSRGDVGSFDLVLRDQNAGNRVQAAGRRR